MKFIEKIYNYDNITFDEIDEVTTRARAILINSNNEVLMCYSNGLQHYEKPQGKQGEEWEKLIENDKRKKEYCKKHCIPLKIIKYDQDFTILDLI